MNVLYVDDQKENLTVFRIAFKRLYKVYVTESSDEALNILNEHPIDVIISDHRMPGISGVELLVKAKELYPDIKRIIISEYVNDQVIRDAMKAYKFDGAMGKPWDGDELKRLIEKET